MKINVDNFEVGDYYGFWASNTQGEEDEIKGIVISKMSLQSTDGNADILIIHNVCLDGDLFYLPLKNIISYYHICSIDEGHITSEVYDPTLEEFCFKPGTNVKEILSVIIDNWEHYDDNEKETLLGKIKDALTTDVFVDLITGYVNSINHSREISEKYTDTLKNQLDSINKYKELKSNLRSYMPSGTEKILDVIIYDICGFCR